MSTQGSGASTPSHATPTNEDAYLAHDGLGLYVVCDGASDGPAGEVAAKTAVQALEAFVADGERQSGRELLRAFRERDTAREAIIDAMTAVVSAALAHPEIDGMSTTVTMLLAYEHRGVISHVGDSRAYLLRGGFLHLLTADHHLTVAPDRTSAAVYDDVQIDCFSLELRGGDTFLLCTDGAEDVIEDPHVLDPDTAAAPWTLANRIVAAARRNDPSRDATVVVVRVRDEDEDGWLLHSEPVMPWEYGHAVMTA